MHPAIARPSVYFQATVAQMGGHETINQLTGDSNPQHLNNFYFFFVEFSLCTIGIVQIVAALLVASVSKFTSDPGVDNKM